MNDCWSLLLSQLCHEGHYWHRRQQCKSGVWGSSSLHRFEARVKGSRSVVLAISYEDMLQERTATVCTGRDDRLPRGTASFS